MKNNKTEPIPVMDYRQYRRARKLVHECCNYIAGNCIALDDGEECICVQSISYSLLCRWFRAAVLPQDKELDTDTFLPIVQGDTVSGNVVAALMHQFPRSAVLAVIHDRDRFSLVVLHK